MLHVKVAASFAWKEKAAWSESSNSAGPLASVVCGVTRSAGARSAVAVGDPPVDVALGASGNGAAEVWRSALGDSLSG